MRAWLLSVCLLAVPAAGCALEGGQLAVSSPTIQSGEPIPRQHTCDENARSPPIEVENLPPGTETVMLVMTDRTGEAPSVGWILWNIEPGPGYVQVPEGQTPSGASVGSNSEGARGYAGPCPPSGSEHSYRFSAYALDKALSVEDGASLDEVQDRRSGHVVAEGHLVAPYAR